MVLSFFMCSFSRLSTFFMTDTLFTFFMLRNFRSVTPYAGTYKLLYAVFFLHGLAIVYLLHSENAAFCDSICRNFMVRLCLIFPRLFTFRIFCFDKTIRRNSFFSVLSSSTDRFLVHLSHREKASCCYSICRHFLILLFHDYLLFSRIDNLSTIFMVSIFHSA